MNLRGEVVTALDLRRLLGRPDRAATDKPMNVVLRNEGGSVSLLVDEIESVEDVEDDTFEPIPDTVTGAAREYLSGAYKLPEGLLLTLDVPRLLDPDPHDRPDAALPDTRLALTFSRTPPTTSK